MNGTLSVEWAAILMLVMVVAVCVGVKRFVFKVVAPISAVVILAAQYSHGDTKTFGANLSALFALSVALLGFYIMLRGVFGPHRSRRED